MKDQMDYWDKTWDGRIDSNGKVSGNQKKFEKVMDFIWRRPQYFKLSKLEIGCGPAQHALDISQYAPHYTDKWVGVDLSRKAIDFVNHHGLYAYQVDFLNWRTYEKFQCFTLWDSLEHFKDPMAVADKICELATEEFMVQGNIPLYVSPIHDEGGVEEYVDIIILKAFWKRCGLFNQGYEVYGINGLPYMIFEANNFKEAS